MSITRPGKSKSTGAEIRESKVHPDYYTYGFPGWWDTKETIARGMSVESLKWSIKDCFEAGRNLPQVQGKYSDEASIYQMELNRRGIR